MSSQIKNQKIPWGEKFSAPPKLGDFEGAAQLKVVKIKKIGKNGLSVNKMKGKVL